MDSSYKDKLYFRQKEKKNILNSVLPGNKSSGRKQSNLLSCLTVKTHLLQYSKQWKNMKNSTKMGITQKVKPLSIIS